MGPGAANSHTDVKTESQPPPALTPCSQAQGGGPPAPPPVQPGGGEYASHLRKDEGSGTTPYSLPSPGTPPSTSAYPYYTPTPTDIASPVYGGYATTGVFSPRSKAKSKSTAGKRERERETHKERDML